MNQKKTSFQLLIYQLKLIGENKTLLTQFKTKDLVDHVGLSQPLLLWKELMPSKLVP